MEVREKKLSINKDKKCDKCPIKGFWGREYIPPKDLDWCHIYIINYTTYFEGNDFALDDVYFGTVIQQDDEITNEEFNEDIPTEDILEESLSEQDIQDEGLSAGNIVLMQAHSIVKVCVSSS